MAVSCWGGGPYNVTWSAVGGAPGVDFVDIVLLDLSEGSGIAVGLDVPFDQLSHTWTTLPLVDSDTDYKIEISDANTGIPFDSSNTTFSVDNIAPTVASVTTHDDNEDGNVDKATIVFSESVRDSSFVAGNFSIDGQAGTSIVSGAADDNTFSVLFTTVTGTGVKTLVYVLGGGHDLADPGNLLAAVSVPATDAAAPVFLSAETKTTTTIEATFSENLNGATVNDSGNEFAVIGHTVIDADEEPESSAGVVLITLSTAMGTGETPDVTFDPSGSLFEDLAGNQAISPTTHTAADGVAPVLTEITAVITPTLDDTPNYTFNSSEAGEITYGGGCLSATTVAVPGDNVITFSTLADGTYNACTVIVTDSSSNVSNLLAISSFQVDTTPVEITNITSELNALTIGLTTFSPALSDPLLRVQDAHYVVRATSIVAQTIPNVQWKITITGPSPLTPDMVDLDEVGWEDIGPNPDSTDVFHYPFAVIGGNLVATGSCDTADVHSNVCTTDGFEIDPTDNFKNIDRVNFAANAPLGTYSIKRQLIEGGTTPRSDELTVATFIVTNNLPVLDAITDETVDELTELAFQATASDTETSTLTFTLEGAPAGASITSDGDFTWTPTEEQGGNPSTDYSFTVRVTDADGGTNSQSVNVTVNEVNVAPVATGALVTTNEDVSVLITLPATDADLPPNTLTYSIESLPVNGVLNVGLGPIVGNQVTYTPNQNYNGLDSLTFQVTDNGVPTLSSSIETITLTVTPVNDPPVLGLIPLQVATAGVADSFTVISTDVDGGAPVYSLSGASAGVSIDSGTGLLAWDLEIVGAYTFDVVVSDGFGGTDTQTVQVTVNHAAIAKVVVSAAPTTLSVEDQSTITVIGKDQFNNVATSDSSTVVVLSADNGGSLGTTLLTLTNGVAETALSKSSEGNVHVNVSSGSLTPSQVTVTFNAIPGDVTPPSVVSHAPADDATGVSVSTAPHLVFSEPLKATTVNSSNIQLRKFSDESVVSAVVSLVEGGTTVIITPNNALGFNTQYYLTVSNGVQDEVGNSLIVVLDATTKTAHEFTTVALEPFTVDDVVAQSSTAEPNNTYVDGWRYTYHLTINATNETEFFVMFEDWLNTTDGVSTFPANGNMRVLFNGATGGGIGAIVGSLSENDIVNGFGNVDSYEIGNNLTDQKLGGVESGIETGILDTGSVSGRQIQFDVFTKIPVDAVAGAYEADYTLQLGN